jgi:hypothetical protein
LGENVSPLGVIQSAFPRAHLFSGTPSDRTTLLPGKRVCPPANQK